MRRVKIICTLGPATESEQVLSALVAGGMDIARLNFSHGSHTIEFFAIGSAVIPISDEHVIAKPQMVLPMNDPLQ